MRWLSRHFRRQARRLSYGFRFGEAKDEGGAPGVAGIDDAAHGAVSGEEGIGFINEEGWTAGVYGAKESAHGDIGGDEGFVGHGGEHTEESGFATAFLGRLDGDVGDDVAEFKGPSMKNPHGKGGSGVIAEDDVFFDGGFDVGQEGGDLDGFGMRSDVVEDDGLGFHNGFLRPLWRRGLDIGRPTWC